MPEMEISNARVAEVLRWADSIADAARTLGMRPSLIHYRATRDEAVREAIEIHRQRRIRPLCKNECGQRVKRRGTNYCSEVCKFAHETTKLGIESRKPQPAQLYRFCKNECGQRVSRSNHLFCSHPCRWEHHRKTHNTGETHHGKTQAR